mmetsp:Transcript_6806/g.11990  ORF Transcript_6806/g.11990 Transcript_6806/m.11990 type:complete len:284 (-) Transcript_6806:208-1059(-)|eukprot:CAMPEP_0184526330 /NCGR_PEP_ID=MMETSP0198_2-20121128/10597_1 /TAXON_ID=1112570 /ORGANISM="Thraustochytrium sp., Strain LLF1b" /LENGTH=283 /DNA_ID=CAMNT_0026917895 /DNA_START=996 /DNA_END=1847 /DNA_ORIENTATION=+
MQLPREPGSKTPTPSGAQLRERAWSYSGHDAAFNSVDPAFPHLRKSAFVDGPNTVSVEATAVSPDVKVYQSPTTTWAQGLRRRALSETGRRLLLGAFDDDVTLEPPSLPASASPVKETRHLRKLPKHSATKEVPPKKANMFAHLLGSSDDEEEEMRGEAYKTLLQRSLSSSSNKAEKSFSSLTSPKIEESVVGEDDDQASEWETVSAKKKKKRDPTKPRPPKIPTPPTSPRNYGYSSEDDDLYDLQAGTFSNRQYGTAKKSMQFKAAAKRSYQINKRNNQRNR